MELEDLKRRQLELQNKVTDIDSKIACSKDSKERLKLMNESKAPKRQLSEVNNAIARIERTKQLREQQAQRDAMANQQNNASGRTRNRQRDINL